MNEPTNPLNLEEIKGLMERARPRPGAPGWHLHDSHFFSWLADQGVSHETVAYLKAAKSALPTLIEQYERMREALERRDAKAAECPIDRTRQHRNEPCPRCRAGRGETCFVKNDADYRLVSEVRDILATQQEETNG